MFWLLLILFGLISLHICAYLWPHIKEYVRYRKMIAKLPTYPGKLFLLGHILDMVLCSPAQVFAKLRVIALKQYPLYVLYLGPIKNVMVFDPVDVEAILSTTKHNTKAQFYKYMDLWLGQGLLVSSGYKWQTRRKILTPAFHFSILQQFTSIFNTETEVMVKKLIRAGNQPYVDLKSIISELTLYTINETSMGSRPNSKTKEGKHYIKALNDIGLLYFYRVMSPWYVVNWIYYNFTLPGLKEKKTVKTLHDFTAKIIKKREESFEKFDVPSNNFVQSDCYSAKKKLAFLDLLLNAKLKEGVIDDQGIMDEVNTFMFEDEVYQEIMQIVGKEKSPSYQDLQELQFMERCIKESLRLYPSVPLIGRVLSEDLKTSVGVIPKGASVYIQIYDIHREPSLWTDPNKFDPDRFLPENCLNRHPFQYIPFSAGPRNCIGQRFAILEMKAALAGILRKFKLEPIDKLDNMDLIEDMILRPAGNARVKFVLRDD